MQWEIVEQQLSLLVGRSYAPDSPEGSLLRPEYLDEPDEEIGKTGRTGSVRKESR